MNLKGFQFVSSCSIELIPLNLLPDWHTLTLLINYKLSIAAYIKASSYVSIPQSRE